MTLKTASRTSQNVLVAEFTYNFDDTMVSVAGTEVDFGLTNTAATSFDLITLPPGSVVVGGELVVETAFDAATYAVIVGDSVDPDRYLATADRKAAARVALTPTGYRNVGGLAVRIEITCADVCTTGKATIRIQYTIDGRATEVN